MALFQYLSAARENGSVVISPFSLHRALLAVLQGCGEDSKSAQELLAFLSLPSMKYATKHWEHLSKYANKKQPFETCQVILWNEHRIGHPKSSFSATMQNTEWLLLDGKTLPKQIETLNQRISALTHGNIRSLIELKPSEVGSVVFIIANAIYFKGNWAIPFSPRLTKKEPFYAPDNELEVDMMRHKDLMAGFHCADKNSTLVELRYQDSKDLRMGLLLPQRSNDRKVWDQFLRGFSMQQLQDAIAHLRPVGNMKLRVPRFEVKEKFNDLQETMKSLGVHDVFTTKFDFSRATDAKGVFVSKVIHHVVFKMDEHGTEASAATAVVGTKECMIMKPRVESLDVTFDHPFLYYIRDASQDLFPAGLLFLGVFVG
jgi:serpin B